MQSRDKNGHFNSILQQCNNLLENYWEKIIRCMNFAYEKKNDLLKNAFFFYFELR